MIPVSKPMVGDEEIQAIRNIFEIGWLGQGNKTAEFEDQCMEYLKAENFVAVNTGTSALHLALRALNIGPGHEVIVPALTFAASIRAITMTGAEPVFCDVGEDLNMDCEDVERLITKKTAAIMPVHFRGNACDLDKIAALAGHGIKIVQDAAHAFGSTWKGENINTFGNAVCYSFDPIKMITCIEGGGVVFPYDFCGMSNTLKRTRMLGIDRYAAKDRGNGWYYDIYGEGYRYHMPNVNAAVGLQQLKKVDDFIAARREICLAYDKAFENLDHFKVIPADWNNTSPFIYVLLCDNRRKAMDYLKGAGIGTGVNYIPCNTFTAFQRFRSSGLQKTNQIKDQILTIPLHSIIDFDLIHVIETIRKADKECL